MTMFQAWGQTVFVSFQEVWFGIASFLPTVLFALIVFILGWILAALLGKAVTHAIALLKVDSVFHGTEIERIVNRSGHNLNIARFFGVLVEWFIIIAVFLAVFDILQLPAVNLFLVSVLGYIPNVIIAVAILLIAAVAGEFLQKVVRGSMHATGVSTAALLGSITKWAIWIFGLLAALDHLQIAVALINTLSVGVVVALSLGFGLAFGLGGQQAASETIARIRNEISGK
jgi:hypothetical protein